MTHLLALKNLSVCCQGIRIVNAVSLDVRENEVVALVGESGSGKSMIARSIMGLLPSKALSITSGSIHFENIDLTSLDERSMRKIRGRHLAYIPQSPLNALNPLMSIGRQLTESSIDALALAREKALSLLNRVGFLNPALIMHSYPHQLSGGMRQRVLIAMALMNSPKFLIADEPTTALDVTLQAEILELLQDLKEEYGLGILFITHDLGIVAKSAQRVYILYRGEVIESADVNSIFYSPQHSYTQNLIGSLIEHPTSV